MKQNKSRRKRVQRKRRLHVIPKRTHINTVPFTITVDMKQFADAIKRMNDALAHAFTQNLQQVALGFQKLNQITLGDIPMATIPQVIQTLGNANADPKALRQILVAVIMRLQQELGEDEPIIIRESDLHDSWNWKLVVTDMADEGAATISIRPR